MHQFLLLVSNYLLTLPQNYNLYAWPEEDNAKKWLWKNEFNVKRRKRNIPKLLLPIRLTQNTAQT